MSESWDLGNAPSEKLDVVDTDSLKPSDRREWYTEEEIEEWEEDKDKPLHPILVNEGAVQDGHHRVSIADRGRGKAVVEKPTTFEVRLEDGRTKYLDGYHGVKPGDENLAALSVEDRRRTIRKQCETGMVEEAYEDGDFLCDDDTENMRNIG